MRAAEASEDSPYPIRAPAEQLGTLGAHGYALADKAIKVAEDEAERRRGRRERGCAIQYRRRPRRRCRPLAAELIE